MSEEMGIGTAALILAVIIIVMVVGIGLEQMKEGILEREEKRRKIAKETEARRLVDERGRIGNAIANALRVECKGTRLQVIADKERNGGQYYLHVNSPGGILFEVFIGSHCVGTAEVLGIRLRIDGFGCGPHLLSDEASVGWLIDYLLQRIRAYLL